MRINEMIDDLRSLKYIQLRPTDTWMTQLMNSVNELSWMQHSALIWSQLFQMFVPAALTMMDTLLALIADIPLQLCPASVVSGTREMAGLFSSWIFKAASPNQHLRRAYAINQTMHTIFSVQLKAHTNKWCSATATCLVMPWQWGTLLCAACLTEQ